MRKKETERETRKVFTRVLGKFPRQRAPRDRTLEYESSDNGFNPASLNSLFSRVDSRSRVRMQASQKNTRVRTYMVSRKYRKIPMHLIVRDASFFVPRIDSLLQRDVARYLPLDWSTCHLRVATFLLYPRVLLPSLTIGAITNRRGCRTKSRIDRCLPSRGAEAEDRRRGEGGKPQSRVASSVTILSRQS